jgi:O-antigen ligase
MASAAPRRIDFVMPETGWQRIAQSASPRTRRLAAMAGLAAIGATAGIAIATGGPAALILAVVLLACCATLYDFRAGVALMIVIMPISQSYLFPHAMFGMTGLNPLNLLTLATLASYVLRTAGEKGAITHFIPKHVVWLLIAPMAMGAFLGMSHVGEIPMFFRDTDMIFFDNGIGYWRDMFGKPMTFVIYALLVAAAVHHSKEPQRFITPMVISSVVMAMAALIFFLMSGLRLSDLAGSYARNFLSALGLHANDLGRLYACAYALLLFVWDRTGSIGLKTALVFAMGLVVLALLVTFSRGAFLGFILVNVIYLFSRRHVKTLLLAAAAIPVALVLMPGAVWYRITLGFGDGLNALSAGRVGEIWEPLSTTFANSPIWGNGLGSIMWSRPMIEGRLLQVAHPHNAYLEAYIDTGVIGLVLFFAFWIVMWRKFRAYRKDPRLTSELQGFFEGAAAGLAAFLVAGLAGSSLTPAPEQAFLWLTVGVMYGVQRKLGDRLAVKRG